MKAEEGRDIPFSGAAEGKCPMYLAEVLGSPKEKGVKVRGVLAEKDKGSMSPTEWEGDGISAVALGRMQVRSARCRNPLIAT